MLRLLLAACCLFLAAAAAGESGSQEKLEAATKRFVAAIADSAESVRSDPQYADDPSRAAGAAYLVQMLLRTIEAQVLQDPDYPLFRVVDFRSREGGDNPDQRYLVAPLRGGESYRVWGWRRGERRLEFQVYAGLPWSAEGGKLVAALTDEQLRCGADGRFDVLLSADRRAGNWLENPRDGSLVMVRQVFSDWRTELPGEVHIDRIGREGELKPALTSAEMAQRLDRAAAELRRIVPLWPGFVRRQYEDKLAPNTLSPPFDPATLGGVKGRWMAVGHFDLAEDQALVLTTWPTKANYQGVQLTDPWFSSLEYANRQTSLSADQSWRSADGAYRFVIAAGDPGVQNWLDTAGQRRGVILLRYDGLQGKALPQAEWPEVQKVQWADLKKFLPADTPAFDAAQRREAIAQRRRHIQRRFGV
jgi:hypothetical protein